MNWLITLTTAVIIALFYLRGNWDNQYQTIADDLKFLPDLTEYLDTTTLMVAFYFIFGFLIAFFWYLVGKWFSPFLIKFIIKFLGGLASTPFIDKDVNKNKISWIRFLIYYFNLVVSMFAFDLLIYNSFYFEVDSLPTIYSLIVTIALLTLIEPIYFIYDSVGIRSYNKRNTEIYSISGVMSRISLRLIQTGGLLAVIASLSLNLDIVDNISENIRVIFVRTVLLSMLILFFYTTFFQAEAIFDDWKKKSIPAGKTIIKIDN
jgi:hypothetical protein